MEDGNGQHFAKKAPSKYIALLNLIQLNYFS